MEAAGINFIDSARGYSVSEPVRFKFEPFVSPQNNHETYAVFPCVQGAQRFAAPAVFILNALARLKSEYGCERITIQTGGTLNGLFLREKLFDYVDIVVAPVLIGGKDTSTLIDGKSLLCLSHTLYKDSPTKAVISSLSGILSSILALLLNQWQYKLYKRSAGNI